VLPEPAPLEAISFEPAPLASAPRKATRLVASCRPRNRQTRATLAVAAALLLSTSLSSAQTTPGTDLQAIGDPAPAPHSIEAQPIDVQTIFHLTNQDRAAQGLPALQWNPDLAAAASAHAQQMATAGQLSHRYPNEPDLTTRASQAGAHFSSIAENIALAPRATQIEQQWMHSVAHRTNILDPHMNAIGVAVTASNGTLYAVEDFAATVPLLPLAAVEDKVETELRTLQPPATPPLTIQGREEARRNCPLADGLLPGSPAALILRWQGSDLTLPQPLTDAIHTGHYTSASVGACPPSPSANPAFVTYRVAVLLY
jgi:uncharacterized protein YkwD